MPYFPFSNSGRFKQDLEFELAKRHDVAVGQHLLHVGIQTFAVDKCAVGRTQIHQNDVAGIALDDRVQA